MSKQRKHHDVLEAGQAGAGNEVSSPASEAAEPGGPPTFMFERTIHYIDGQLGDSLERAKTDIRAEARAACVSVKSWDVAPIKVLGMRHVTKGLNDDKSPRVKVERDCEIRVKANVSAQVEEKWVRLTTASGPAAVEVMTTMGGQPVGVKTEHEEDLRQIAVGFAERALRDLAGP